MLSIEVPVSAHNGPFDMCFCNGCKYRIGRATCGGHQVLTGAVRGAHPRSCTCPPVAQKNSPQPMVWSAGKAGVNLFLHSPHKDRAPVPKNIRGLSVSGCARAAQVGRRIQPGRSGDHLSPDIPYFAAFGYILCRFCNRCVNAAGYCQVTSPRKI